MKGETGVLLIYLLIREGVYYNLLISSLICLDYAL